MTTSPDTDLIARWPGYDEQSWSERFAELDWRHRKLQDDMFEFVKRCATSPHASGGERAIALEEAAVWRGGSKILPDGARVTILAADPAGRSKHDVPARTACWIRYQREGGEYPMYRSCDLADLEVREATIDALANVPSVSILTTPEPGETT